MVASSVVPEQILISGKWTKTTERLPAISIHALSKSFGSIKAVDNLDLSVEKGKIVTLLGPSGCGKTTTLRMVAGLEKPDTGEIRIDDKVVNSVETRVFVPPEKREIGMVFQSYALWPHMTVFDNVAYPLKVRRASKPDINEKTNNALKLVRLEGLEKRYPNQLSGGQQQRVALARALVFEPEVLLLYEPLSNLDAKLRESMRFELRELQRRLGIASLYVTHDQEESLFISDVVCVMNRGKIEQSGTPREVHDRPTSEFVANFVGRTNLLRGAVLSLEALAGGEEFYITQTSGGLKVLSSGFVKLKEGEKVAISIRPEYINIVAEKSHNEPNVFKAVVKEMTFLGDRFDCRLIVGDESLTCRALPNAKFESGATVFVQLQPEYCIAIGES
jgi:iron(III) transport system ATP-binding protein